jgi:hypothetical protein
MMVPKPKGDYLRIIAKGAAPRWTWELVSQDGHVFNRSEPFRSRSECEKDATERGFLIAGERTVRR